MGRARSDRYREAGVDIDTMEAALARTKDLVRGTFTPGVAADVGLFGGLFDLEAAGAGRGLLVASTDGVGTKTKVAAACGRLDTIGRCLVNHCVNDILVQGARPLFFLDYYAAAALDPAAFEAVLTGLCAACRENGVALLGGETAEMPGVYEPGEFDLAGTIVGVVPDGRVIDGSAVRAGDRLFALHSSGLHTNGYSLARRILFDEGGLKPSSRPARLEGASLGEALLAVHRSYLRSVFPLLSGPLGEAVHALAHVTGGGIFENLPRVLPAGLAAEVDPAAVPRPPIFDLIVERGGLSREEAYRVFNMGIGFVLVVDAPAAERVAQALHEAGEPAHPLGRVVEGEGVHLK